MTQSHPVWMRDGSRADAPLLVLLHGMSQTPTDWIEAAPRLLALPAHVLLPAGPFPHEVRSRDSYRIGHAWYLYDGGPDRFRHTVDQAERWLTDALAHAEVSRGWHPSRRILLGYSQGAYFAYVLAMRRQDLFSHLVAVAGRLKEEFLTPELASGGTLRTLIVHGDRDRSVHPDAAVGSHRALDDAGYPAQLVRVPTGHAFTPQIDALCADWVAEQVSPA